MASVLFDSEVTAESDEDCIIIESDDEEKFDRSLSFNIAQIEPKVNTSFNKNLAEVKTENTYKCDKSSIDSDAFHSEYIIKDEDDLISISSPLSSDSDGNCSSKQESQSEKVACDISSDREKNQDEPDSEMPVIVDINEILNKVESQTNASSLSSTNSDGASCNGLTSNDTPNINVKLSDSLRSFRKHWRKSIDGTVKKQFLLFQEFPNFGKKEKRLYQSKQIQILRKYYFRLSEKQIKSISALGHICNKDNFTSKDITKFERLLGLFISKMNEHHDNHSQTLNQHAFSKCCDYEEVALQKLVTCGKLTLQFNRFENLLFKFNSTLKNDEYSSSQKVILMDSTSKALIVLKELFIAISSSFNLEMDKGNNNLDPLAPKVKSPQTNMASPSSDGSRSVSFQKTNIDSSNTSMKQTIANQSQGINTDILVEQRFDDLIQKVIEIIAENEQDFYKHENKYKINKKFDQGGNVGNVGVHQMKYCSSENRIKTRLIKDLERYSQEPRLINRQHEHLQVRNFKNDQPIKKLKSTSGESMFEFVSTKGQIKAADINHLQQNCSTMSSALQSLAPSISNQPQLQPYSLAAAAAGASSSSMSMSINSQTVSVPKTATPQDITAHIFSNGILLEVKTVTLKASKKL